MSTTRHSVCTTYYVPASQGHCLVPTVSARHSPDSMDNTTTVLEKDHGGFTGTQAGASNVEDVAASRTILSEAEDTSDDWA